MFVVGIGCMLWAAPLIPPSDAGRLMQDLTAAENAPVSRVKAFAGASSENSSLRNSRGQPVTVEDLMTSEPPSKLPNVVAGFGFAATMSGALVLFWPWFRFLFRSWRRSFTNSRFVP